MLDYDASVTSRCQVQDNSASMTLRRSCCPGYSASVAAWSSFKTHSALTILFSHSRCSLSIPFLSLPFSVYSPFPPSSLAPTPSPLFLASTYPPLAHFPLFITPPPPLSPLPSLPTVAASPAGSGNASCGSATFNYPFRSSGIRLGRRGGGLGSGWGGGDLKEGVVVLKRMESELS